MGIHGRERLARPLTWVLLLVLACSPLEAQPPASNPSFQDLRAELDARIAAAGATMVSISCEQNLRERACVAEIDKPGAPREVLSVTRSLSAPAASVRAPALAIDARPLFAQRAPMLDVAWSPDGKRLIVLEPYAVAIRQWTPAGDVSDVVESRPVQTVRVWPRDLRGRVRAAQMPFDVFLPGVTCRGDVDPFRLSCADESAAWPGLANAGVEAARNYFTTPEGRTFFSAAPVSGDTSARWLVADPQGAMTLLDEKRSAIAKLTTSGDDVAAIQTACAAGSFVIVSARSPRDSDVDELRLFRVTDRELVPAASPLRLSGTLTALWASSQGSIDSPYPPATAIVYDVTANRYEAFQLSVSCAR